MCVYVYNSCCFRNQWTYLSCSPRTTSNSFSVIRLPFFIMQWAAVRTQFLAMRVPPQIPLPLIFITACHGQEVFSAFSPPITRPLVSFPIPQTAVSEGVKCRLIDRLIDFLVSYVEDRPRLSIQSPNKEGRKEKVNG